MRKLIVGSLVAATLAGLSLGAQARSNVDFYVNVAPPAVRPGYVWVPGYWEVRHNRRHWVEGRYVRHVPAYYAPARWRDNDRDGVPNRYDRAPNNPYRR